MKKKYRAQLLTFILIYSALTSLYAKEKISCLGNSITFGYGLPSPYYDSYPSQWQLLLDTNQYTVDNYGVSGTTMLQNGDNPYWKQTAFTNAMNSNPDHVVIELGTNDSKLYNWYYHQVDFSKDYKSFIDTLKTLTSQPDVWITLAPYSNNSAWGILDTSITLRINPDILKVGIDKAVNIIDLHSTFNDLNFFLDDSVHPNQEGAKKLASIINNYFNWNLGQISKSGNTLNAPPGYGWQWYRDNILLEGETSQTLNLSDLGSYKVLVKIEANTETRLITNSISIDDLTSQIFNTIPSNNKFQYTINNRSLNVFSDKTIVLLAQIFSANGKLLSQQLLKVKTGWNQFELKHYHPNSLFKIIELN